MSNIIIQGNEINAKKYVEKITIEGVGEEKSLNPRIVVAKGGNSMINYSTEEQVIGTWIDGKPLYKKTFELSSRVIIATGFTTVISDITEFNIDKIIASIGYDNAGTTDMYDACCPAITFAKSGSTLLAYGGSMAYGVTAFTLQYTKTTD